MLRSVFVSTPEGTLSRFVRRRGLRERVVTDNSRNFLGASGALKRKFHVLVDTVSQDMARRYMMYKWKFNASRDRPDRNVCTADIRTSSFSQHKTFI